MLRKGMCDRVGNRPGKESAECIVNWIGADESWEWELDPVSRTPDLR